MQLVANMYIIDNIIDLALVSFILIITEALCDKMHHKLSLCSFYHDINCDAKHTIPETGSGWGS